jgi:hypothetical protein
VGFVSGKQFTCPANLMETELPNGSVALCWSWDRKGYEMRVKYLVCAAIVAMVAPTIALADDPRDPAMRDPAARARDRETIRQLNLRELAMVRERDAGYAKGWRASRDSGDQYAVRTREHQRAIGDYARDRERYEREMAAWRRAVAACGAGDYSACD